MIKDDQNGTISCWGLYNLLYRRNVFGKQRIQMFDTLGQQKMSMFFPLMDKDEDGFLSSADLRSFASIFGRYPSDESIDRVTSKLDMDGDSKISLEDFSRAMTPVFDGITWEFWLVAILEQTEA
ncbi:Calmodulin-2 [Bienertia sinuspersici]